jgi:DNA-binding winged helix-turn-helix (wHTH) protein
MGDTETGRSSVSSRRRRRRWSFGSAVFDEAGWSLLVDGEPVAIESKPLELLHELCLRAGEVVSKDELLDTVWSGVNVVENSIPTAVAKLRRCLGPNNQNAIETVPGVGYRVAPPVSVETISVQATPRFAFVAGDCVPGRPQWQLVDPLGDNGSGEVWRGRHAKTGETRVFKFADAPDRLRALKREAALSRLLLQALGPDGPFVQLLEWNFADAPYFLEYRDAGLSLRDWATAAGGLGAIAIDQRLDIAVRSARALAAVHGVGVLHKDIKPGNILVDTEGGKSRVRLADFGSGRVFDDAAVSAYAITDLGDEASDASDGDRLSGTPFYRAPEIAVGAVPTAKSDIYSLGLVLFQLVVGDFGRVPAPGWEREVADPLLRSDIADAAAGDPAARIGSASELADRLANLGERRAAAMAEAQAAARLEELASRDARRRARRPWIVAAASAAALGIIGTSVAAIVAVRQRDEARRHEAVARASYDFLANDLLARADPYHAGSADETIAAASRRASVEIDRRFAAAPLVAAGLHHALARAFDQRTDLDAARVEYTKADRDYRRAGAAGARDHGLMLSQWAQLEALSGDPARLPIARALLAKARTAARDPDGEVKVWFLSAEGSLALAGEDVRTAQTAFIKASEQAEQLPDAFDARQRLNLRQRVAFMDIRLGNAAKAEAAFRPLLADFTRLEGADHPDTLNIRLNLVQALLVQRRYPDVIEAANALLPVMEKAFGPDHRRTLQLVAVRQQALGSVERYADAARDGERVWRATAAHEGATAFQAVAGRADTAESQCRAGLYDQGLANARAALAAARKAPGPETALAMAIRTTVAGCLIGAGQAAEAAPLLANIDRTKVSELVGDAAWGANLDLALARVELAKGDKAGARTYLAAARTGFADHPDPFQKRLLDQLAASLAVNQ